LNNILEIKSLYKSFGGVKAVSDCSFGIEQGKIVALLGPNGSGKTTVFNLISGILVPDLGKVILDNNDVTNHSVEERARMGISRLFQQSRLFANLSIKENLLLSLDDRNFNIFSIAKATKAQTDRMHEILSLFGLFDKIDVQVKSLSYGQRRLVEIARAYLLPHKVLLLDEPVAGVAPHLRDEISKFLTQLKEKGETILVIEHDMSFVFNLVDEMIVMDAGKCIARGKPREIRLNKEVNEAYFGA